MPNQPLYALAIAFVLSASTPSTRAQSPEITPDIVYGHKHGLAMTLDHYKPTAAANGAAVVFMVSGGWYSRWSPPKQALPLFNPYLSEGYHVFAVRHGSSPRYSIPEAVADVRRAIRFIRLNAADYQINPERLGVLGMSAGGHLSLMLGTSGDEGNPSAKDPVDRISSRVAAVAALVPPTDLTVAVWTAPESLPAYRGFPALDLAMDLAEAHSPLKHVTSDDAPSLVIMGGKDELVPPKHGTWIAEAFKRENVDHQLIILPEAGHGLDINRPDTKTIPAVVNWFNQHLTNQ